MNQNPDFNSVMALDRSVITDESTGFKYRVQVNRVWECARCKFEAGEPWCHPAKIYEGLHFHSACLDEMHKKSRRRIVHKHTRGMQAIIRLSMQKPLSPQEMIRIAAAFAETLRCRVSSILPEGYQSGYYKGKPIVPVSNDDDGTVFTSPAKRKRREVERFWYAAEDAKLASPVLELALLLTLLGDKNAITHATQRNPNFFRGGKAANSRNNPKHQGRRA